MAGFATRGSAPEPEAPPAEEESTPAESVDEGLDEEVAGWLPYDLDQLSAAADLAAVYAREDTAFDPEEDTWDYHERMSEMTTEIYSEQLEPGAGTISARESMASKGVTVASTAEVTGIHAINDDQLVFVVQVETVKSGGENDGEEEEHEFVAVTVPHEDGDEDDEWRMSSLELSSLEHT